MQPTSAILVTRIYRVHATGSLVAMLGGVASLAAPFSFEGTGVRAYALVFLLPPSEEREVRTSASSTGASLNEHFAEFAATRWRAIKLPKDYDNLHLGERLAYNELPEKYMR